MADCEDRAALKALDFSVTNSSLTFKTGAGNLV